MAAFANDTPSPDQAVLRPMVIWNMTGVNRHDKRFWLPDSIKQLFHALNVWGKPAIEAYHHQRWRYLRPDAFVIHFREFRQCFSRDRQGLFDEDMFPHLQGLACKRRMAIMPRRNDDGIDLGGLNNTSPLARDFRESKLTPCMGSADTCAARDRSKRNSRLLKRRQENLRGIVSRTDTPNDRSRSGTISVKRFF